MGVPLHDGEEDGSVSERGLTDDEFAASEATLQSIAATLDAECVQLRGHACEENAAKKTAQFLIRKRYDEKDFMEIRIAVVGNVDAGKSTLLGTDQSVTVVVRGHTGCANDIPVLLTSKFEIHS